METRSWNNRGIFFVDYLAGDEIIKRQYYTLLSELMIVMKENNVVSRCLHVHDRDDEVFIASTTTLFFRSSSQRFFLFSI